MNDKAIYLRDIALDAAQAAWAEQRRAAGLDRPLGVERVTLDAAAGRVTAGPVYARLSSPHYHASAMDGFAVRAAETAGATETRPLLLALGTAARYVDTGDPIPAGFDAVIMIEHAQRLPASAAHPDGAIEILAAAAPWQYIRPMGEDVVATELLLPANHRLRPQDLGALAAAGHAQVDVFRQPRVAIVPTGSELVPPGTPVKPGDIIEYNSLVLGALAEEAGAIVTRLPIHHDDFDALLASARAALREHDLVVLNAGSSAGSEDFSERVFSALGALAVHGVAIRPGHPVMLGVARADPEGPARAVAGIPGYPVSAVVTFELFCLPLLRAWQGLAAPERVEVEATLTRKVVSPAGDDEFVRVCVGEVGERLIAMPLSGGAGVITSLVKGDGVLHVPRFSEGVAQGAQVRVALRTPLSRVRNTVVAIGSHDMTLDLLSDFLGRRAPGQRLVSSHVGSVGGLLALQRGEAHLAGCHLLDEASGEYNTAAIAQYLTPGGVDVVVLGFTRRTQGLIVARGNPKGIRALGDLTRPDVSFINRQRGAGTRALLDYELKRQAISARQIRGYERQEFTHLAVAAQVASGAVDCGMGILAAARALDLDFVPLTAERYDLIIPAALFDSARLAPLLALIRDPRSGFAAAVQALGGYDTAQMGVVLSG
ncbi:MAG: molybdopterin biosynthesis protein [Thermoflexales bacterium]|nr:molybdopterin biosynthesis protein [Thermoflexales bacterium]